MPNNKTKTTGTTKPRFHSGIAVLVFGFIVVIVYVAGTIAKSFAKTEIPTMVVRYDVINIPKDIAGVVIRDEKVYKSPVSGTLEYLANETDKIKKGAPVARIKDASRASYVETDLEQLNHELFEMQKMREAISLFSPEVDRINRQIKQTVDKNIYRYINADTSDMYMLKEMIEKEIEHRNQIIFSENRGSAGPYVAEKENYEAELSKYINELYAPEGGIISYNTDGLEEVFTISGKDGLSAEQIGMKNAGTVNYPGRTVSEDDDIYKIVSSNEWFIAAYIENDLIDGMRQNDAKTIFIETDEGYASLETTIYSISRGDKESNVLFRMTKYMIDYIDVRNVSFRLTDSVHRGLKIPDSAIVNRTFLKIPEMYINNNRVTKNTGDKSESITVMPFRNGLNEDEGYTYVSLDIGRLSIGDTVTSPGLPPYTISMTASVRGIFTANDGVARFREISEDTPVSSCGYSLLDPVKNPGLRTYDRIIINASNIYENQIIN